MKHSETTVSFYKTGGTLAYNHPSYVEREADRELFEQLQRGEYCYILTSRQMGKSSLMVRTALRLRENGATVATVDLTAFGNTLTQEQWYDAMLSRIGQQLDLETELEDFWFDHPRLGFLQRWIEALIQVILPRCPRRFILFIDEIDLVRSYQFGTDEFFAGIRECYNRRAQDPELQRLVFCLSGVASPAELIQDVDTTPFNIGRRIELRDFTLEEAGGLAIGLEKPQTLAKKLIQRILYWTGGHPYLTQSLCAAVAKDPSAVSTKKVDQLCIQLFLSNKAIEKEDNLIFVRERVLQSPVDRVDLLNLYTRIYNGKEVPDDDSNPLVNAIKLAGLCKPAATGLVVRNRIYRQVFNKEWIRDSMPDAELRRQKVAYRQGAVRAAVIASVLFILTGIGIYRYWDLNYNTRVEYYNTIVTRWGAAEGFGPVDRRDVPKRNRTYKFFIKGWPQRKVIKYQIVNCFDEPCAYEKVESYFTNAEGTVNEDATCQWEYVYDTNWRVVYEKHLNRSGKFVGGFVYLPTSTRVSGRGYYVDKQGFPLHFGKAEYVNIEWLPKRGQKGDDGCDWRIKYLDRQGKPQPGRDHAYGQLREFDKYGLNTRLISIDAKGNAMIDDYGNAVAQSKYDVDDPQIQKEWGRKTCLGNLIEVRNLDTRGKLIKGRDGWAIIRQSFDDFNSIEQSFWGTHDEPITDQNGVHLYKFVFKKQPRENQYIVETSDFGIKGPILINGIFHTTELYNDPREGFLKQLYYGFNKQPIDYDRVDWKKWKKMPNDYILSNIGWMYENGSGVKQNYEQAAKWYLKAVSCGDFGAINNLAYMYYIGRGVKLDYVEALKWYRKSAARGDSLAMSCLGLMYQNGFGVKKDYQEAIKWYQRGAMGGNIDGMKQLGLMYKKGIGVDRDYREALKWYRKAAIEEDAAAMSELGWFYHNGYGVKQDDKTAFSWFLKGARKDDTGAIQMIAAMYYLGMGVRKDEKKAFEWIKKGAELRNPTAFNDMGEFYTRGLVVKQDYKEAEKWYRMAANKGNADAMNRLGWLYENGYGVCKSKKLALIWYSKAASHNNQSAKQSLKRISKRRFN